MDSRHSTVAANTLLGLAYRSREAELTQDYPQVLTLLCSHFIGMEEGFAAIRKLAEGRVRLRLWAEESLLLTLTPEELAVRSGVDDHVRSSRPTPPSTLETDALFIPVLSLSLLSRLTQLDTSDSFVQAIVSALCAGKPVGAIALGAQPQHYLWGERGLAQVRPLLQAKMQAMVAEVEGYGITLLEPDQLSNWPASAAAPLHKQVLTAEDIHTAYRLGSSRISLRQQAIVTPLAADLARQYGIELQTNSKR
ncbi:hypothetical protein [Paenibacillus donghaensis]|uniref:Ethanolamine utilization protein n=1 Tax=Paenibacillus donghaensis TaxID=414771 RepID=A0A2Z2KRM5_9BACL|nr:hypothetical protein [Paenibacillus donghaensis]ASA24112.1 hypothetical protein B9T62_27000 [Paenibacillus donghaensis]